MNKKKRKTWYAVVAVAVIAVIAILWFLLSSPKDIVSQIQRKGYTGSAEELLASLAGENAPSFDPYSGETAFEMAIAKGYKGSYSDWTETILGKSSEKTGINMYELAVENGYSGSLASWLDSMVDDPSKLGKTKNGSKTDYELACDYGFQGTFSEWLVSLIK